MSQTTQRMSQVLMAFAAGSAMTVLLLVRSFVMYSQLSCIADLLFLIVFAYAYLFI